MRWVMNLRCRPKQLDTAVQRRSVTLCHAHGGALSLIHISEPTRRYAISYAVFCLKKKNFGRPPRELQCSDRAQTSTTGSGRASCIDVDLGFWLKVLVRRDKYENRRKNRFDSSSTTYSAYLPHMHGVACCCWARLGCWL